MAKKIKKSIKLNPTVRIPADFLLYTDKEGAEFQFLGGFTVEMWNVLINTGFVEVRDGDRLKIVYPAYAALCTPRWGFDFIIDEMNGDRKAPKERTVITSMTQLKKDE
jgi:hypothetical protein